MKAADKHGEERHKQNRPVDRNLNFRWKPDRKLLRVLRSLSKVEVILLILSDNYFSKVLPQSEIQIVMERNLLIKNKLGLHARAAAKMVQISNGYSSDFSIRFDGQEVDGKSILSILTLACPLGSNIILRADGADADKLLNAVERLIDDKFGEE